MCDVHVTILVFLLLIFCQFHSQGPNEPKVNREKTVFALLPYIDKVGYFFLLSSFYSVCLQFQRIEYMTRYGGFFSYFLYLSCLVMSEITESFINFGNFQPLLLQMFLLLLSSGIPITVDPQITSICSMLFHYNIDEMP